GGVNLTLTGTTDGTPETLTVSDNSGAVRGAIEGFVNAFNNFASTAGNLTAYNADSGVAGALQGDFTARSVINQVRSVLSGAAEGFDGPFSSLSELGITTQADGRLQINSATLDTALADNFESVVGVFAQLGVSSDSGVEVSSTTSNSQVGSYAVNVSQLASQSALTGAAIGSFPVTIDGTNDSFAISINGVSSGSLSLTQASYANGTELAAELQSRINGASALADGGISVSVSFNGSNQLEIRSDRFGSDSSVEITSLEDGAAFGLSLAVGSTAVDVAGTIGGVAATGVGQRLIGASGDPSEGVNLLITGATLGDRGTVNVSQGIAAQLDNLLSQFLQSNGLFDLRADGLQSSVERLGEDREVLDRRLEALEGRYRRQFNALDTLLANLQSTGDFISTQLAAIPLPGSNNN
ncbi:MAG: flagellar hook-associated protein 2, partial [Halieaceae bacterium]